MTEAPVYSLWTSVVTCLSTVSQHLAGLSLGKISDTAQTVGTFFFSFHLSSFFSPWGAEIVVNCLQERPSELPSPVSTEYYCSLTLARNTGGERGWFRF